MFARERISATKRRPLRRRQEGGSLTEERDDLAATVILRAADNQLWEGRLVEQALRLARAAELPRHQRRRWIAAGWLDLAGCPTPATSQGVGRVGFKCGRGAMARSLLAAAPAFPRHFRWARDPGRPSVVTGAIVGLVGNHAYSVMEVRELHGAAVGRQTKLTSFVAKDGVEDVSGRRRADCRTRAGWRIREPKKVVQPRSEGWANSGARCGR